jgi:uncharacterized membrane protein YcaP (DUF421 family)
MDAFFRGITIYLALLLIFRLSGRRTLSETTTFEFVLLLIISETTQEAMINGDHSITNALILILTLVGSSMVLSLIKAKSPKLEKWLEGTPILIIEDGKINWKKMDRLRVDENDVLEAARANHGLERLEQIKHAIVERNGEISIIPRKE